MRLAVTVKFSALPLAAHFLVLLALNAPAATYYVDINSTNPTPPYADWSTAATDIQDAVDAATNGDLVLVTNGVYDVGSRVSSDGVSNRVLVANALTLQSVSGMAATLIDGGGAMRCVYLTNGAVLSGFTVTNGNLPFNKYGGGVYCASSNALVANCLVISNQSYYGGGIIYGSVSNCIISCNTATYESGGGAEQCILNNCTLLHNAAGFFGGGASLSALSNCVVFGNSTGSTPQSSSGNGGGGVYGSVLNNCLVISNTCYGQVGGGGTLACILNNCTVVGNSAPNTDSGGGINFEVLGNGKFIVPAAYNCIIFDNSCPGHYPNVYLGLVTNCCAIPLPGGAGNITNDPAFVNPAAGDFHLQSNSPCINSGNNAYVTGATDLDGNSRIVGGTVDMGAYEYQTPTSVISYAYLQQYGLPTDGSVDDADLDGTAFNVFQDWIAGLNPTNPASVLAMLPPPTTNSASGITVSWESVGGISYDLLRATNLTVQPAFSIIQTNITGQAGTTSYTDTTATNATPYFYRVAVQ